MQEFLEKSDECSIDIQREGKNFCVWITSAAGDFDDDLNLDAYDYEFEVESEDDYKVYDIELSEEERNKLKNKVEEALYVKANGTHWTQRRSFIHEQFAL